MLHTHVSFHIHPGNNFPIRKFSTPELAQALLSQMCQSHLVKSDNTRSGERDDLGLGTFSSLGRSETRKLVTQKETAVRVLQTFWLCNWCILGSSSCPERSAESTALVLFNHTSLLIGK